MSGWPWGQRHPPPPRSRHRTGRRPTGRRWTSAGSPEPHREGPTQQERNPRRRRAARRSEGTGPPVGYGSKAAVWKLLARLRPVVTAPSEVAEWTLYPRGRLAAPEKWSERWSASRTASPRAGPGPAGTRAGPGPRPASTGRHWGWTGAGAGLDRAHCQPPRPGPDRPGTPALYRRISTPSTRSPCTMRPTTSWPRTTRAKTV